MHNKKDPQKKHRLRMVTKKSMEGLNMFNGTDLTLSSDVDNKTGGEHDQEIPQSHTAYQPTAPGGKATEH